MPIQKNKPCRMSDPEKGQLVTIILMRASTGVCENHNHLSSIILPWSHLEDIGKSFLILIIFTRLQGKEYQSS